MARMGKVLTSGQVAAICKVTPATVNKWFDSGKLQGYRIPSGSRRVPFDNLLKFMGDYGIPTDGLQKPTNRSVLVVDDDPNTVELVEAALPKAEGWTHHSARDGYEGCAKAGVLKPNLMIIDLGMLGTDGDQVGEAIRRIPETRHCKILAVADHIDAGEPDQAKHRGADECIEKSSLLSELRHKIKEMLRE